MSRSYVSSCNQMQHDSPNCEDVAPAESRPTPTNIATQPNATRFAKLRGRCTRPSCATATRNRLRAAADRSEADALPGIGDYPVSLIKAAIINMLGFVCPICDTPPCQHLSLPWVAPMYCYATKCNTIRPLARSPPRPLSRHPDRPVARSPPRPLSTNPDHRRIEE